MIYIYDILLNFIDGNRVYEFFEWDKNDIIENIKRIPLYLVKTKIIDDALNKEVIFDNQFLTEIKNKTLLFTDGVDQTIKYSFLLTNGERCYAFELDDYGKVIYKSSLLLDEEEEILEISQGMNEYDINYKTKNIQYEKLPLTRMEVKKNHFIEKDLTYTYKNKNYHKLTYLYSECFGYDDSNYEEKYNKLLKSINSTDSIYRNKLNFILNLSHKLYVNK